MTKTIIHSKPVPCSACTGTGMVGVFPGQPEPCVACKGTGTVDMPTRIEVRAIGLLRF